MIIVETQDFASLMKMFVMEETQHLASLRDGLFDIVFLRNFLVNIDQVI